jgi:hypothetical protein
MGDSFANELQKRMVADIESCGGHAVFERVSLTELNQADRNTRIDQFKADVVLTIQLTGGETMDGAVVAGNVDSKVWDVSTKKIVWRGSSAMHMGTLTPASTTAESLYKDLMPKLRYDGMVPACGNQYTAAGH